jgi:hypothetical protein
MTNRYDLNKNLAQMLKGGVIMDVQNPEQARIAEAAGAAAVMALERIPADIRAVGGVSRMSDPKMIKEIQDAVSIPVMAKVRIGHFVEAQILQAIEIDYIDESEVLTPADDLIHVDKTKFDVPFVCGAGSVAYLSQLNSLGWTVPASIFRNAKTLSALHYSAFLLPATVLACQATGFEYRNFIPRWSHDRERRRDETEVRQHIAIGSAVGLGFWAVRLFALRMGRGYRSPLLEIVIGGGLADLMDREDRKTHGL